MIMVLLVFIAGCQTEGKNQAKLETEAVIKPLPSLSELYQDFQKNNEFFAFNAITPFHLKDSPNCWENTRQNLKLAKEAGAHGVRIDMWWGVIEPAPNQFDWSHPDRVMKEILDAGLEPLPILCYNPKWDPDKSPATMETRRQFGNYVFEMVNRYKGRVHQWEVWNEPNVDQFWTPAPNAGDYTELLKTAYRKAKEADPHCTVVGFCTAFVDEYFLRGCYENGAAGNYDAVSVHSYSSTRNEADFEQELLHLRDLMTEFGDGDKPILITESGYGTINCSLIEPMSYEDQAQWVVKKHLLAQANGVDSFYYFKLVDDPAEVAPDGAWGLIQSDYTKKLSFATYQQMTRKISNAQYIGKFWRAAGDPNRRGDVEFQVFLKGEEIFAAAWVRNNGDPITIAIPAREPVSVVSLSGEIIKEVSPTKNQTAMVELSVEPVWLENLSREVLALASVQFSPNRAILYPGVSGDIALIARNPLSDPIRIGLNPFQWPVKRRQFTAQIGNSSSIEVAPGQKISHPLSLIIPAETNDFSKEVIAYTNRQDFSYQLPIESRAPVSVALQTEVDKMSIMTVTAEVTNLTGKPLAGRLEWKGFNELLSGREQIDVLVPGKPKIFQKRIAAPFEPDQATVEIVGANGFRLEQHLPFYAITISKAPFSINGELNEWWDLSKIELNAIDHQLIPGSGNQTPAHQNFAGTVQFAANSDYLFFAADIKDQTTRLNSSTIGEVWFDDSIEVYIGSNGPTLEKSYSENHFQFGLTPGNGDNIKPGVWNLRATEGPQIIPNSQIQVNWTDKGYILEGKVPLSSLSLKAKNKHYLGFNIHLNNRTSSEEKGPSQILIWTGGSFDWQDPSGWGVGLFRPDDTTGIQR